MRHSGDKYLFVCGLSDVPDIIASTKADALVSALHPELVPKTPDGIVPNNHFKLTIDDIDAPFDGLQHAKHQDIERLCAFANAWHSGERDDDVVPKTMVVHCYAGISRSTAAAFVILCALNPDLRELTLAKYLQHQSPTAVPNRLMVSLGDEVLGRKGRMVKAIDALRGTNAPYPPQAAPLHTRPVRGHKTHVFGPEAA